MIDYKAIEAKLDKMAPIRVRGLLKKRKETIEEFICTFFRSWNEDKDTICVNNGHTQTAAGARRSLGDIYKICKYYYPKCTLKQVAKVVYEDCFEDVDIFRSSFCSATKKRMFYVGDNSQDSELLNQNIKDEFGYTCKEWLGKEVEEAEDMDEDNTDWDE